MDDSVFRHLCTFECALRVDEFWSILKSHYSGHSNMITKGITVQELREKIAGASIMSLASLNQSHPPPTSQCQQIRLRTNFYDLNRRYWTSWDPERYMKFTQMGPELQILQEELDNIMNRLIDIMKEEAVGLAYALRVTTSASMRTTCQRGSSFRMFLKIGCR